MTLQDIATDLENLAEKAWEASVAESKVIVQEVEPVVESALAQAVNQFGELAVQTVIGFMQGVEASFTGGEKLNLTVTTLIDAAEKQAVTLAQADATALAKTAYAAVMSKAPASTA